MHDSTHASHHVGRFARLLAVACILLLASTSYAAAQAAPARTAQQEADRAAIQNFPLSMDVMQRIEATIDAGNRAHLPCMSDSDPSSVRGLDAMAHELATKEPRAVPILARHGFTPKQFYTAMGALVNTGLAAEMLAHPGSPFAKAIRKNLHYNAKNVAFYNAHRTQINAMMKKIDGSSSCGD